MFTDPSTHSFAGVPTSIFPDHSQNGLAQFLDFLAAPLQKLNGDAAHWSSINETQEHFLKSQIIACHPSQKDAIASQSFWIRIIFLLGLLYQSQRLAFFTPTRQLRLGKSAPPSFVLKAPNPTMLLCQSYDPVTRLFLRAYSGSGLVIQCLARFQETFNRFKACLTQSSLTWREVMPSAKLTSAANSSVHTLFSLPKSLGLRCNMAFNFSRPSSLNIGRVVFGRREPISKASTPRSLKATMALRTVCSSQPRNSAIRGAFSPRALDKMIWLRLTVNGLEDRNPSFRLSSLFFTQLSYKDWFSHTIYYITTPNISFGFALAIITVCMICSGGLALLKNFSTSMNADKIKIEEAVHEIITALSEENFEEAYSLFLSEAKKEVPISELKKNAEGANFALYDGSESIEIQNFRINTTTNSGKTSWADGIVHCKGNYSGNFEVFLNFENGIWKVNSLNVTVPPQKVEDFLTN